MPSVPFSGNNVFTEQMTTQYQKDVWITLYFKVVQTFTICPLQLNNVENDTKHNVFNGKECKGLNWRKLYDGGLCVFLCMCLGGVTWFPLSQNLKNANQDEDPLLHTFSLKRSCCYSRRLQVKLHVLVFLTWLESKSQVNRSSKQFIRWLCVMWRWSLIVKFPKKMVTWLCSFVETVWECKENVLQRAACGGGSKVNILHIKS